MLRPQLPTPCLGPSQGRTRPGKSQPPSGPGSWSQPMVFCQFGEASDKADPRGYFKGIREKQDNPSCLPAGS